LAFSLRVRGPLGSGGGASIAFKTMISYLSFAAFLKSSRPIGNKKEIGERRRRMRRIRN